MCTVNNIGYVTRLARFHAVTRAARYTADRQSQRASKRPSSTYVMSQFRRPAAQRHAHNMCSGWERSRISGLGFREYSSVVSLNFTPKTTGRPHSDYLGARSGMLSNGTNRGWRFSINGDRKLSTLPKRIPSTWLDQTHHEGEDPLGPESTRC